MLWTRFPLYLPINMGSLSIYTIFEIVEFHFIFCIVCVSSHNFTITEKLFFHSFFRLLSNKTHKNLYKLIFMRCFRISSLLVYRCFGYSIKWVFILLLRTIKKRNSNKTLKEILRTTCNTAVNKLIVLDFIPGSKWLADSTHIYRTKFAAIGCTCDICRR